MSDKRLPVTGFSFFLGAGLYWHKYKLECIESQTGCMPFATFYDRRSNCGAA